MCAYKLERNGGLADHDWFDACSSSLYYACPGAQTSGGGSVSMRFMSVHLPLQMTLQWQEYSEFNFTSADSGFLCSSVIYTWRLGSRDPKFTFRALCRHFEL